MKEKRDAYVFISYASADRPHALELYQGLGGRRRSITCWMDVYDITVDDATFQEHILRGIQNASALVLVESQASRQSVYVQRELAQARTSGIPVFRYRVAPLSQQTGAAGSENFLNKMLRRLGVAWLDLRIKFRITQPLWLANLFVLLAIAAMGAGIFFFGRTVTPLVVEAIDRSLPQAAVSESLVQPTQLPMNPQQEAPFHFAPQELLLADDFNRDGSLDETTYQYDIKPRYEGVAVQRQAGSLFLDFPNQCSGEELFWDCELELNTKEFRLPQAQYLGLRLRSASFNPMREVSFSLSVQSPYRRRTGFGWAFASHVTPFFRPNIMLPEPEYYAYIPLDDRWHAYEILVDPIKAVIFYYVDGQLIDQVPMAHFQEWQEAPLVLLVYTTGEILGEHGPKIDAEQLNDTHLEIDQIIIGRFTD